MLIRQSDGNDLSKIDPQVYRKHIGIVSQEPALFGLTIAQNIGTRFVHPKS